MIKQKTFLVGWKAFGEYVGFHFQTIRGWSHKYLKLPVTKTHPSKQGRVVISVELMDEWLKEVGKFQLVEKPPSPHLSPPTKKTT